MTGLFDGLGTLIILSLLLLGYAPLITTLVLREARILDFVAAGYRPGGYILLFLLLGCISLCLFSIYTLDGIFVFAFLNTLIFIFCRIRKLVTIRKKEQHKTNEPA